MASTFNFLNRVYLNLKHENSAHKAYVWVLLLLVSIPAILAASNIATGFLFAASIYFFRLRHFRLQGLLTIPILLFCLMALSYFWSINKALTAESILKELPLMLISLVFMIIPAFNKTQKQSILFYYGWAMVLYSVFYLVKAMIRFVATGSTDVFFYHELVTLNVNAIYVSVFLALGFFSLVSQSSSSNWNRAGAALLFVVLFLLSSKNIMFVFIGLLLIYGWYYAGYSLKSKLIFLSTIAIIFVTLLSVPKIRERFYWEYIAMTTDGSASVSINTPTGKIYNVSVRQAWENPMFKADDFFSGTALRVYQFRVFTELLQEDHIFWKGYGLNASLAKIEQKADYYHLYPGTEDVFGYKKYNFHNQYLQNFADLGIFGLLLLLLILTLNLRNALLSEDFVHISFAILMISLFLTESFLWRQRGVMFFTAFYCFFNAISTREGNVLPNKL